MATCPRCKGPLTDDHRCPNRRGLLAIELIASALAGGILAVLLLAAFDPSGQITDLDTITFVVGCAVGVGVDRFLRF